MVIKYAEKHHERVELQVCQHYWVIEAANGGTSKGVCQFCGEERLFNNYLHIFGEEGGEQVDDRPDHKPAPKPTRVKGEQTESKETIQATLNEYTKEDFRRWGAMGGRGNKRKG
ncbi:hypothetical protein ACFLXE_07845 [Chloroflexota bacterium]